jgi:hypothetical protein
MFESIFASASDAAQSAVSWQSFFAAIGVAFALGLLISFVYMLADKRGGTAQSFVLTLVTLPVVITLIILLVGSNVARAFSLAGAFSIIRFRSAVGSPKDLTYVFFTMAVGLALGVGLIGYGVLAAVVFCLIMLVLSKLNYGAARNAPKRLRVALPETVDYNGLFDDVFYKYAASHDVVRVRTVDLGSLFEVVYNVTLKKDANEKNFIDELRCRNGNLAITISAREEELT